MEDVKIVVCRLCLNFITLDESQELDNTSKDILKLIVPEIDLGISVDPKICQLCYKTMLRCYRVISNFNRRDNSDCKEKVDTEAVNRHTEETGRLCNFCSNNVEEESLVEFNSKREFLKDVLRKCLPEEIEHTSTEVAPCKKCLEILKTQYIFTGNCTDSEDKLTNYCLNHGTNSSGKLNLYEAAQHILSKENKGSNSGGGKFSYSDFHDEINEDLPCTEVDSIKVESCDDRVSCQDENEDLPFPEVQVKTENIEMESVDIKHDVNDLGTVVSHKQVEGDQSNTSGVEIKITKNTLETTNIKSSSSGFHELGQRSYTQREKKKRFLSRKTRAQQTVPPILAAISRLESLSQNIREDEFVTFGRHVANQLRSLPLTKAITCQNIIINYLSKERLKILNSESAHEASAPGSSVSTLDLEKNYFEDKDTSKNSSTPDGGPQFDSLAVLITSPPAQGIDQAITTSTKKDEKSTKMVKNSKLERRSIGIQVNESDMVEVRSIGVQVDFPCPVLIVDHYASDLRCDLSDMSDEGPQMKRKKFKPRILRRQDKKKM